ncbi:MAG: hypothetical protein SVW02_01370 [Candidatus Nanohaloarchaea archaeon]|nr:hypothetical protein [Candidatus Nanohaloarchaea archaeon]
MVAASVADLFALSFLGLPLFAVLWRYSALPEIEWDHIVMGALFFLGAQSINVWSDVVMGDPRVGVVLGDLFAAWAAVFDIIGAALVVEGILWNAYDIYQK